MSRRERFQEKNMRTLIYIFSITLVISIIAFVLIFVSYNRKLKMQSSENLLELGKVSAIVDNFDIEETSFSNDKTIVNSSIENISQNEVISNTAKENENENKTKANIIINNIDSSKAVINEEEKLVEENSSSEIQEETELNRPLKFQVPVSGEIIKDYAKDTLIYSNTLEEWTTHLGIDIKAKKTSVVAAAEEGKIESIKNDPRYGVSITISHANGFKTVYSNLLTTEFVSEGDIVEKGETIATVGETASFEILDDNHLHFEMYKDGECVNPTIYLK